MLEAGNKLVDYSCKMAAYTHMKVECNLRPGSKKAPVRNMQVVYSLVVGSYKMVVDNRSSAGCSLVRTQAESKNNSAADNKVAGSCTKAADNSLAVRSCMLEDCKMVRNKLAASTST